MTRIVAVIFTPEGWQSRARYRQPSRGSLRRAVELVEPDAIVGRTGGTTCLDALNAHTDGELGQRTEILDVTGHDGSVWLRQRHDERIDC